MQRRKPTSVMRLIILMTKLHDKGSHLIPKLISKMIRLMYGCDIQPTVQIDREAELVHGGLGCVFHENIVIERRARIYQNVTLGGNGKQTSPAGANHPVIREGATVYAGACVLGPIEVGAGATVGANAVVLSDVPAGATAVGVPARMIEGGI